MTVSAILGTGRSRDANILLRTAANARRMRRKRTRRRAVAHRNDLGFPPEQLPAKASTGFTVHLARSKIDVQISPGETILGALIQAGVDVPYSCEEGICGACETKLLSGVVLHQDSVRSPEEHDRRGTLMICCSLKGGGGNLTLDI